MGISLKMGRTFDPGEQHVVIVSESFARQQWPGANPLGQTMGDGAVKDTVIGVVGNAHINALSDDDALEQYWAAQPDDMPGIVMIARSSGEPGSLALAAKAIAISMDSSIFPEVRELKALYRDNVQQVETGTAIVTLVGLVAVALAGIGLVGLVGYVVTQRTKEDRKSVV